MSLSTLQELLPGIRRLGRREAILFDNGFRTWRLTHEQVWRRAAALASRFASLNLKKGDRVAIWSENRPEWVIAFWACVARGLEVVPVDGQSSGRLFDRIRGESNAQLAILGETVQAPRLKIPTLGVVEIAAISPQDSFELVPVGPDDIVQIVYTSGTTGDPRGVVHRHRNICANLAPFQREIHRYRGYARPFQPIRILDQLPLSHLFGQSLGLFIPVFLGGSVVFMTDPRAAAAIRLIGRERVSVLATVPGFARNFQSELERRFQLPDEEPIGKGWMGAARRWWRYRRVHHQLGLKFWCLVLGGSAVAPDLERFWRKLGFVVVQGYGLTESSPVIAVNHPFNTRQGSIGKPVEGQTVRLAADGEILVSGESVATEYLESGGHARKLAQDGWLHTGDVGTIDSEGRIYYKGRKKDVIVTGAGLNVYPQDVEAALNLQTGVRESVVVAKKTEGGETVHAALLLKDGDIDPSGLVAAANRVLETHQRIRSWSIWPEPDFPRTPSTLKVKRGEVARTVNLPPSEASVAPPLGGEDEIGRILSRLTNKKSQGEGRLVEDFGLSSLDRIELLSRLEDRYGVTLDEERFAQLSTIDEVREAIQTHPGRLESDTAAGHDLMPRWGQWAPVRLFRGLTQNLILLPGYRILIELSCEGLENVAAVSPPTLFAANHNSHLDVPSILAALPWRRRAAIAPAMLQDYFLPHFRGGGFPWRVRWRATLKYHLACALFGAFPLPHRLGGVRDTLRYTGELVGRGICPLVFPEGERSDDGQLQPFKPGIGLLAIRLEVPVVPVYIQGAFEAWSKHDRLPPGYGKIRVRFGRALRLGGEKDPREATAEVEKAIRRLALQGPQS